MCLCLLRRRTFPLARMLLFTRNSAEIYSREGRVPSEIDSSRSPLIPLPQRILPVLNSLLRFWFRGALPICACFEKEARPRISQLVESPGGRSC